MRKLLLLVMLSTTGVMAESTMYVGDKVKIPMRADASIAKNNVINHLSINTPVTLIKKQANGWSNIKVDGKSGWMISRYLTDKKPSNLQAEKLKKRIISMSNHNKDKREQEFKINKDLYQILLHGRVVSLTRAECKILMYMVEHPNRVHSKEHLLNIMHDRRTSAGESTIVTHIRRIRIALKAINANNNSIKTHIGLGYSLVI